MDWWVNFLDSEWLKEKYCGKYSKRFLFDVALAERKLERAGSRKAHGFWAARTNYYVEPSEDLREPFKDELVEWLRENEGATGVIGIPN